MRIRFFKTSCTAFFLTLLLLNHRFVSAQTSEEAPQQVASTAKLSPLPKFILALGKGSVFGGKQVGSYCLRGSDKLFAPKTIFVVGGVEKCTSAYGTPKLFYIVFRGMDKFYVDENDLVISAADIETLHNLPAEQMEAFLEQAKQTAANLRKIELEDVLKAVKSHEKTGVTVVSSRISDESEYTDGTGFSVSVLNPTSVPIKYIWFTVVGYNAVGDPVQSRQGTAMTVRGIGPINKGAEGSYEWRYLWHTDIVESFQIKKIKVQYMNGTTREINKVGSVTLTEAQRRALSEVGE